MACAEALADVVAELDTLRLIGANLRPAGFRESLLMCHADERQAASVFGTTALTYFFFNGLNTPFYTMWSLHLMQGNIYLICNIDDGMTSYN